MKNFLIFIILLFLPGSAWLQKSYSSLLHKTYAQRCRQVDSLFRYSYIADSAALLKELNIVATLAKSGNDKELYLETELIKLHRFDWFHTGNRAVDRLQDFIEQADNNKFLALSIIARHYLASYYNLIREDYGAAIEQYLNAYYLLKPLSPSEFPNKINFVYNDVASIYYGLGDLENAKKFLLEADTLPIYVVGVPNAMREAINVSNTLGLIYRKTAQYDSAILYFQKARETAVQANDQIWVGIAGGNIGITYFLQKRYDKALPLIQEDVRISRQGKEYGNAANSLLKLAQINLEQDSKAESRTQLQDARTLISASTDAITHLENYFPLMAKLCKAEGKVAEANNYLDSALNIKDTIARQKSAVALARAQQKTDVEHHRLEMQVLQQQKKTQVLALNTSLFIIVLLITITILLVSRQKLLKKQKQFADIQKQLAVNELQVAQNDLESFAKNIREKNALLESLAAEMDQLQTYYNHNAIDQRSLTIEQLRQSTILNDLQWETFRQTFDKAYPGYLTRLHQKLQGISAADLRFLALSKLKLNSKEMAAILGISPGSVRMSRHRVRKKFGLEDDASFEIFIESV